MNDEEILQLELTMSPRAIDRLKALCGIPGVSKYELPSVLFPEDQGFDIKADTDDEGQILLCFDINEKNIVMSGSLIQDNFFCTDVLSGDMDGKHFVLYFRQEKTEDYVRLSDETKKRLDMWYGYIDSLMKKAEEQYRIFFCRSAEAKNNKININVYDLKKDSELKGLTVGFLDDKNQPAWGFGSAETLSGDILTVKPFGDNVTDIMKELSNGVRLVAYDGAADITCKRMRSGLDKLKNGDAVNKHLPEFIFEPKNANTAPGENIILREEELLAKNMNPEQLLAVEGALNAQDLYLIQGPPGTGKTTVIAEICYQNAIRGLKTLIVSQSNLAVDNAISRVMNDPRIRVLRKGDNSRVEEEGLPFVEDNVVGTWLAGVSEAAADMDEDISERLAALKSSRERLPDILAAAENVFLLEREKTDKQSQLYFYRNVFEEAHQNRAEFFELIDKAYEFGEIEPALEAKALYPEDFKIPMEIYNNLESVYMDVRADIEMMRSYKEELEFLNDYTGRFVEQFEYIYYRVSPRMLANTAFTGVFYYADEKMVTSLYNEGEEILDSEPTGLRRLIFTHKWKRISAIYLRRAENLMMSIQQKTVRICDRLYALQNDKTFNDNVETFHLCLDAIGKDFQSQYYAVLAKCEKLDEECEDIVREHSYAVQLFRENVENDPFYGKALKNMDAEDIRLEKIEYNVNRYYQLRSERWLKWQRLLREWRNDIGSGSGNYGSLKKLYIDNANVIGITCIQSGTKDFSENYPSFDTVIIDEASKSTPPDIILPMLKGKKVILVGDHKQLPPFIDGTAYDELDDNDEALKELIKVSLFEELYEKSDSSYRTMLFRQYRMHRDIAALINQFYIDTDAGRLESPASESRVHHCEGLDISEENHVLWYDIPNKDINYEKRVGKSFCNEYEAACVKDILCVLEKNLSGNGFKKSVGVITFYDAQVRLLEREIVESGFCGRFGSFTLRIGSVDRFQGMEEDIIIVSFVRNNQNNYIGFARDSRRINVAMSRAKDMLIIVGSSENFMGCGDENAKKIFGNLYNIVGRLGGLRQAGDIPNVILENKGYSPCGRDNVPAAPPVSSGSGEYSENVNILDRFILKAASEFEGQTLTIKNLSNVLGVDAVFVENRVRYLQEKELIIFKNNLVKLSTDRQN